jgi:hypothetical protein
MARSVTQGVRFSLIIAAVLAAGTARAQAPPVTMPENPPDSPAGALEFPMPHVHAHEQHGHASTYGAPADRRPSLLEPRRPYGGGPSARGQGPHGGQLVPYVDGAAPLEVRYDDALHAVTIYLPYAAAPPVHAFGRPSAAFEEAAPYYPEANGLHGCPREQPGCSSCPRARRAVDHHRPDHGECPCGHGARELRHYAPAAEYGPRWSD